VADEQAPEPVPVEDTQASSADTQADVETASFVQTQQDIRGAIEPRDRLRAKIDMGDPIVRESLLPDSNRTILSGDNIYQLIRYSLPDAGNSPEAWLKTYQVSGDHLYVAEVNTPAAVYVKLGQRSNPWIRVQRGMVLTRKFDSVSIWAVDPFLITPVSLAKTDALFYASQGELVADEGSFDQGTVTPSVGNGTAQATLSRLLDPIYAGASGPIPLTVGKSGGYLQIINTDVANTLLVTPPSVGVTSNAIPLLAGQSIIFPLKGRIVDALDVASPRWAVSTPGGPCTYCVVVSSGEMDLFDSDSQRPGGINT
jgi:hypothetical protein